MIKVNKIKVLKIVVIVIIGIGFLWYMINYSKNTQEKQVTPVGQNTEISVDTTDWLVYENKEYGYRFKYPKSVEVVDGKDSRFSLYELPRSTFMLLPAKYPDIKDSNYKDPKSFENYQISIYRVGSPKQFGKTTDEIVKSFTNASKEIKQIIKVNNVTKAVYGDGNNAYIVGENDVYAASLNGSNPKDIHISGWLNDINNYQLTEWVNNYPEHLRILHGILLTFEII